jgi:hypothetical protein
MTPRIKLSAQQSADLRELRDCDLVVLQTVLETLKQGDKGPLNPNSLSSAILKSVSDDSHLADALIRQILSLRGLMRELAVSVDEMLQILREAIRLGEQQWSNDELDRWDQRQSVLRDLLNLGIVIGTAKALELAYEHSRLLQKARIFTDVRPVFTDDATDVQGAVVSHTLRVRYSDLRVDHIVEFALDERDIRAIAKECERALKKSETIRTLLRKKLEIEPIGTADDTD